MNDRTAMCPWRITFCCCVLAVIASGVEASSAYKQGYLLDERMCPQTGDGFLEVIQVPWGEKKRAWQTIPDGVEVVTSKIPEAGLGVLATKFIPKHTWLAEYEGMIVTRDMNLDTTYTWTVTKNDTEVYDVDASDVSTSNWLRWINCAASAREENVECCPCYGRLYYRTLKDVQPDQEMLVYYGDDYAKALGIDVANFNAGDQKELDFLTELIDTGKS